MEMEALELPDDQARALLASPDAMSDIYKTFSKMVDTGHMDVVRESIEVWRGYCPLSLGLRRPVHSKPPAGPSQGSRTIPPGGCGNAPPPTFSSTPWSTRCVRTS